MNRSLILPGLLVLPLAACNPHVVIEQPKPIEININARVDLVIHDARSDLEQITGEKPTQTVRPEDIGLPASPATGGAAAPLSPRALASASTLFPARFVPQKPMHPARLTYVAVDAKDDLIKAMAARNKDIRALWDSKVVGESHTGLLVAKATLTADQQKLVDAENKDRAALFAVEAKSQTQSAGKSVTPEEFGLNFYQAQLGYAKPGNWYEFKKPGTNEWEWKQWKQ